MPSESTFLRRAIRESMELAQSSGLTPALQLLDKAIAEAAKESWNRSIITLCSHAAILCTFKNNLPLQGHYYELSLQHNPEDYRALYGLAKVLLEEGQAEVARQYAKQSYDIIHASGDPIAHHLLDSINVHWPDIARPEQS